MTAITDADRVGFTGLNDQLWRTLVHMLSGVTLVVTITSQVCIFLDLGLSILELRII